jgi:LCP family protein required for cell wall assembly
MKRVVRSELFVPTSFSVLFILLAVIFLYVLSACSAIPSLSSRLKEVVEPEMDGSFPGGNLALETSLLETPEVISGASSSLLVFAPTRTPFQPLVSDPDNPIVTPLPGLIDSQPTETGLPGQSPLFQETPSPIAPPPASGNRMPNPFPAKRGFPTPMPYLSGETTGKTLNILLIGSDQRGKGSFRTDTLVVASIRPDDRSVALLSIPRDLYVYIPGKGMHKINTAFLWGTLNRYPGGGPALLKDTILYNLGIRIDKIVIVNFNGFKQAVNILGGIEVPVACAYTDWHIIDPNANNQNPANWKLFTVGPGLVKMDGDLALWYARSRMKSSDYDRGRRQQEVLRALYTRAMEINVLSNIPELYQQLRKNLTTDVELADILSLVPMALDFNEARIRSYYITAGMVKPGFADGMYVQWPKGEKIHNLVQRFLAPPGQEEEKRLTAVVEVCNASGKANWDALAADRLHYAGFKTVDCTRNDLAPSQKTSLENLVPSTDPAILNELLILIGISAERVSILDQPDSPSTFRLILGSDYDPCFSPLKLTH